MKAQRRDYGYERVGASRKIRHTKHRRSRRGRNCLNADNRHKSHARHSAAWASDRCRPKASRPGAFQESVQAALEPKASTPVFEHDPHSPFVGMDEWREYIRGGDYPGHCGLDTCARNGATG